MNLNINQQTYQIGKLPALTQFHVLRRLTPGLAAVGLSFEQIKTLTPEKMWGLLMPVSQFLATMPEEDANYVIFSCLGAVKRQAGGDGRFADVAVQGRLMFDDIDMLVMVRLTVEVLRENLAGFLTGLGEVNASPSS